MEAWKLLLGSDIGLMSLFTIGFCVAMAIYLVLYAKRKAEEDARNAK
jgi:hypothetical protein